MFSHKKKGLEKTDGMKKATELEISWIYVPTHCEVKIRHSKKNRKYFETQIGDIEVKRNEIRKGTKETHSFYRSNGRGNFKDIASMENKTKIKHNIQSIYAYHGTDTVK